MIANKQIAKKKPPPTNGFKKGASGNPSGRAPKTAQELDLIAACKGKTVAALSVITDIMMHGEKEQTRLTAALAIIERAYGKPVQPQDVSMSGDMSARVTIDPGKLSNFVLQELMDARAKSN